MSTITSSRRAPGPGAASALLATAIAATGRRAVRRGEEE